jgi:hypothetical protein
MIVSKLIKKFPALHRILSFSTYSKTYLIPDRISKFETVWILNWTAEKQILCCLQCELFYCSQCNSPYFSFICYCYCILQILILDEATAAVDPETAAAVQSTVQKEFKNCTILTIAHRPAAVTTCDRILVMKNGEVRFFHPY